MVLFLSLYSQEHIILISKETFLPFLFRFILFPFRSFLFEEHRLVKMVLFLFFSLSLSLCSQKYIIREETFPFLQKFLVRETSAGKMVLSLILSFFFSLYSQKYIIRKETFPFFQKFLVRGTSTGKIVLSLFLSLSLCLSLFAGAYNSRGNRIVIKLLTALPSLAVYICIFSAALEFISWIQLRRVKERGVKD